MKIGIDLLWVGYEKVGDTESYVENILRGIEMIDRENDYYLFVSLSNANSFSFVNTANFHKVICSIDSNHRWIAFYMSIFFAFTYCPCFPNLIQYKNKESIQYSGKRYFVLRLRKCRNLN